MLLYNDSYGEGEKMSEELKRLVVNIMWITTGIPFYMLVGASCMYSMFLRVIYKPIKKVEPYSWIDALDTWFYKLKNKWL